MGKSLGDYNIEKSSSHNKGNIVWTQRKMKDPLHSKNKIKSEKKISKSSATNCNIKQGFKRPGR